MCTYLYVCAPCVYSPWSSQETVWDSHGTGVPRSCDPPNMGARNWTRILSARAVSAPPAVPSLQLFSALGALSQSTKWRSAQGSVCHGASELPWHSVIITLGDMCSSYLPDFRKQGIMVMALKVAAVPVVGRTLIIKWTEIERLLIQIISTEVLPPIGPMKQQMNKQIYTFALCHSSGEIQHEQLSPIRMSVRFLVLDQLLPMSACRCQA